MRHDIREGVKRYVDNDIEPNYAALSRQYDVDYRTVKKAYQEVKDGDAKSQKPKKQRPSLLDPYRGVIKAKLELNCSAMAIFKFIQKKGFQGQYTIVKTYCATIRKERTHKATIRVEHTAGLSAQVDWKEEMTLYNNENKPYHFNIFYMSCLIQN